MVNTVFNRTRLGLKRYCGTNGRCKMNLSVNSVMSSPVNTSEGLEHFRFLLKVRHTEDDPTGKDRQTWAPITAVFPRRAVVSPSNPPPSSLNSY